MPSAEYMRDYRSRNDAPQVRERNLERLRRKALRELAKLYPKEYREILNRLKREAKERGESV